VRDSTFSGNYVSRGSQPTAGGAIVIYPDCEAEITGSTFSGNGAGLAFGKGGAIHVEGQLTLTNSTFTGNSAAFQGGALSILAGASVTATNVTIAGNTTDATNGLGAGFYVAGFLTLANSIISNNSPNGNCYLYGSTGSITDGGGNIRFPASDTSCVGDVGDPLLSTLRDNGGPTLTMALLPGSAAIGKVAGANGCGVGVSVDQRGASRPGTESGRCSVGAFEHTHTDSTGSDSRCFIATAAFGSWQEKHVRLLRHFRDRYLLATAPGRAFVDWYYRVSPGYAARIARNDTLRAWTRAALLPVYGLAWMAIHWHIGLGLCALGGLGLITSRRKT
jgi:predicted outer membrane repeat protein